MEIIESVEIITVTPYVYQFESKDWPILPVPEEERCVLRHLQWRADYLAHEVEKAEGEKRKKLEAEQDDVIRHLMGLQEAWEKVDFHFGAYIVSLGYLVDVTRDPTIEGSDDECEMLLDAVPKAKEYVHAIVCAILRRRVACLSVLEGHRATWMSDSDINDLVRDRDLLMPVQPPLKNAPAENDQLRLALIDFNTKVEYLTLRDNILNGN